MVVYVIVGEVTLMQAAPTHCVIDATRPSAERMPDVAYRHSPPVGGVRFSALAWLRASTASLTSTKALASGLTQPGDLRIDNPGEAGRERFGPVAGRLSCRGSTVEDVGHHLRRAASRHSPPACPVDDPVRRNAINPLDGCTWLVS